MGKYLYPLCLEQAACHLPGGLFARILALFLFGVQGDPLKE